MKKLLALIAFSFCLSFAQAEEFKKIVIGPFGGLNNRDNPIAIPATNSQDLLNVDVTSGGKSIRKRPGYATAFALTPSTSPVHNAYLFYDSSGNDVVLIFNERRITSSVSGGSITVIYSTATNEAVYDCADYLGSAYCVNSARDALFKTQGTLVAPVVITSTGTMVAACPTRLAMAGFTGSLASSIGFSAETDFASWTPGNLGPSAAQIPINAPGSRITHIAYAFGRLMWFKESSFGYIILGNQPAQTDWVIKTVSNNIGTLDNTSTVDPDGNLYFRGQDKRIYKYDGNATVELSSEIIATITNSTQTATEQAYSTFFDNKLLISIALGSSQPTNNRVLVYDFLSQSWTIYDLKANGFYVRNNVLHFGSATGANVYRFGSDTNGNPYTNDDGAAISAFWISKDFFGGNPFNSLSLSNISAIAAKSVVPSTATIGITATNTRSGIVNSAVSFYTYPQSGANKNTVILNKNLNPASLSDIRNFSIQILNVSSGQTFEVFSIQVALTEKPWAPTP